MPTETLTNSLPDAVERLAEAVLKLACDQDRTLATAESCTGGLLASVLTDVEGFSHAFERGYVVYTEQAKSEEIGVPPELIRQHGVVSEAVARAMAQGALEASGADLAVAVTGFAGGGDEPGLVHLALADKRGGLDHRVHRFGDIGRGPVRIETMRAGLRMLEAALKPAPGHS